MVYNNAIREEILIMTLYEVSKLAGVSVRTLQSYDKIGLLHPSQYSDAGYRLYMDTDRSEA